jgi:hypothetical protein
MFYPCPKESSSHESGEVYPNRSTAIETHKVNAGSRMLGQLDAEALALVDRADKTEPQPLVG